MEEEVPDNEGCWVGCARWSKVSWEGGDGINAEVDDVI